MYGDNVSAVLTSFILLYELQMLPPGIHMYLSHIYVDVAWNKYYIIQINEYCNV